MFNLFIKYNFSNSSLLISIFLQLENLLVILYFLSLFKIVDILQSQSMRLFVNKPEIFIDKSELYDLSINKKFKLRKIAKK